MSAVIEGVRKTFEAEELSLAQAARDREQELTAAAKQRAEEEAENRCAEMIASERQAVATVTSQSVDAKIASAAVAAARVEGGGRYSQVRTRRTGAPRTASNCQVGSGQHPDCSCDDS
eukprot:5433218-Pyramimonas_sp.AAC.1